MVNAKATRHVLAFHLALGIVAARDKDFARAQVHIDSVGLLLESRWLGKVTIDTHHVNLIEGVRGLKRLSEDPTEPA